MTTTTFILLLNAFAQLLAAIAQLLAVLRKRRCKAMLQHTIDESEFDSQAAHGQRGEIYCIKNFSPVVPPIHPAG